MEGFLGGALQSNSSGEDLGTNYSRGKAPDETEWWSAAEHRAVGKGKNAIQKVGVLYRSNTD